MSYKSGFKGLVIGLGIGAAVMLLFAPKSGEEFRDWIRFNTRETARRLRRKGRRSIEQLQDMVSKGQEQVSKAIGANGGESIPGI